MTFSSKHAWKKLRPSAMAPGRPSKFNQLSNHLGQLCNVMLGVIAPAVKPGQEVLTGKR